MITVLLLATKIASAVEAPCDLGVDYDLTTCDDVVCAYSQQPTHLPSVTVEVICHGADLIGRSVIFGRWLSDDRSDIGRTFRTLTHGPIRRSPLGTSWCAKTDGGGSVRLGEFAFLSGPLWIYSGEISWSRWPLDKQGCSDGIYEGLIAAGFDVVPLTIIPKQVTGSHPLYDTGTIMCNDGTRSPTCRTCSRGCCSWHGGC